MKIFATFEELAIPYCERQESTPAELKAKLLRQKELYAPDGWMLLQCQDLCSSQQGRLYILVYGPNNTFKEPATGVVSPEGRASDSSTCIGLLPAANLGE